ncbi:MAG: HPt (histidine-containing phosphotransfer) domain-containing protein [Cellvibrionaceae bacterium]|jgi:HPt (histidine-containing phosphotransfer) domain-containing protein
MIEPDNQIWDRDGFMNRIMNSATIAQKLFELFKTHTPKTIEQLGSAVEAGQTQEAGLLAHKLKGSVSNLGGIELASLAQKIEQAGKCDDMSEVEVLWPAVLPQYEKLLKQIQVGL